MKTPDDNRAAALPLKERLLGSIKTYVESAEPIPMQAAAGTTGALKTAFTRAKRYNDPKTRTPAPTK